MQQFVVPQFIDVEDKIFGPITTRQFLILLTASLIIFLAFRFGDMALFITVLIVIGGGALIIGFVKVNGQHFHMFLLNILSTLKKPSLRVWHKSYTTEELQYWRGEGNAEATIQKIEKKRPRAHHMRDLSLIVNTGGYYRPEDESWSTHK